MNRDEQQIQTSLFLVVFLLEAALLVHFSFLDYAEYRHNRALVNQIAAQDAAIDKSMKVKAQLESLASQTAMLADQGNQNAANFVAALREQGITIQNPQR